MTACMDGEPPTYRLGRHSELRVNNLAEAILLETYFPALHTPHGKSKD